MKSDIYNFDKRLSAIQERIKKSSMPVKSKSMIRKFETDCFASGLGICRVEKYLNALKTIAEMIRVPLGDADKDDLKRFLAKIEKSDWSSWTKHDYRVTLKKFYTWSGKTDMISWIKAGKSHSEKLPEELLTFEEVQEIISAASGQEDRALFYCMWESGCRIGELLTLQVKNCFFDSIGVKIIVSGKTGMRRVRLIDSAPALDECIDGRAGDKRVWELDYGALSMKLKRAAVKANIRKRVYPHLFRHSRATFLASHLTEAQMCNYLGWVMGSGMPRIYVHLSGDDLDMAMVKLSTSNNAVQTVKDGILIKPH
ncbi:MAG: hypothetical protein FIB07_15190 [Candidatus Methanoperedens sp.]|nr:hypothetical protein [Candidatus Methanoperedens sp.]